MGWLLQSTGTPGAYLERWPGLPKSTRWNSCKRELATRFPSREAAREAYQDYRDCMAHPWPHEATREAAGWRVTYDIVTPESARDGDVFSSGFIGPAGGHIAALIGKPTPGVEMPLRRALEICEGAQWEDSGRWLSEINGPIDSKGAEKTRALHPPKGITPSSYARLKRLLGAY